MHQHQLVNFARIFGIIPSRKRSEEESFTAEGYENEWAVYSFLSKKGRHTLTPTQFAHLQRYYETTFRVNGVFDDPKLVNMDKNIEIWHLCRVDKELFQCKEYEYPKATGLNHLACITIECACQSPEEARKNGFSPRLRVHSVLWCAPLSRMSADGNVQRVSEIRSPRWFGGGHG
jgi:hypothetical protein